MYILLFTYCTQDALRAAVFRAKSQYQLHIFLSATYTSTLQIISVQHAVHFVYVRVTSYKCPAHMLPKVRTNDFLTFIVVPVIMAQVIWSVASGPSCCTLRTPCAQCLCAMLRAHINPCGALTTPDTLLEQRVLHPFKQRSRCLNVQ